MKELLKRVTSIMLAASLIVTSVTPVQADEIAPLGETVVTEAADTSASEPADAGGGTSVPDTQEQTQADAVAPAADAAADQMQYIIYLPAGEGYSFKYDAASRSDDLSEEEYTILLYAAGEDVSLDIDPDVPYSLIQMSDQKEYLSVDGGKAEFKMPSADLMAVVEEQGQTDAPADNAATEAGGQTPETQGEPQSEKQSETQGASEAQTENSTSAQSPAQTEGETADGSVQTAQTETEKESVLEWAAENVSIEARHADGSAFPEDASMTVSTPNEVMGSEEGMGLYGTALTEAVASLIAGEDGDVQEAAGTIAALYPFHVNTGADGEMQFTVSLDDSKILGQMDKMSAKVFTYDVEVNEGQPEVKDLAMIPAGDIDTYISGGRIVSEFITAKSVFALAFISNDEAEEEATEAITEAETETEAAETESEPETEQESETEPETGTEAQELEFGELQFAEDGYYLAANAALGTLDGHTFMSLNAENLNGAPVHKMETVFHYEFPAEASVPELSVVDGKVADSSGAVFFELWKQDENIPVVITDAAVSGNSVDVTVAADFAEGTASPFEGWELEVEAGSVGYDYEPGSSVVDGQADAISADEAELEIDDADDADVVNGIVSGIDFDSIESDGDGLSNVVGEIPVRAEAKLYAVSGQDAEEGQPAVLDAFSGISIVENVGYGINQVDTNNDPVAGTENTATGSTDFKYNGVFVGMERSTGIGPDDLTVGSSCIKNNNKDGDDDIVEFYVNSQEKDENGYVIFPNSFWDYHPNGTIDKYDTRIYMWANSKSIGSLTYNKVSNTWHFTSRETYDSSVTDKGLTRLHLEFHIYQHGTANEVSGIGGTMEFRDLDIDEGWRVVSGGVKNYTNAPNTLKQDDNFIVGTERTDSSEAKSAYMIAYDLPVHVVYRFERKASKIYYNAYTLTYHIEGTPPGSDLQIKNGQSMSIARTINTAAAAGTLFPALSYPGYRFEGWYSDQGYTSPYSGTTSTQSNVDVYARFIELKGTGRVHKNLNMHGYDINSIPDGNKTFTFSLTGTSTANNSVSMSRSIVGGGTVDFTDVPVGPSYEVVESYNPDIWTVSPAKNTVAINEGATTEMTFTNELNVGSLNVTKSVNWGGFDESQIPAPKKTFVFTLSGVSTAGIPVNKQLSIVGPGMVSFTEIPVGTYTLTETCDTSIWDPVTPQVTTVTITKNGTAAVTYQNNLMTGNVKVTKTIEKAKDDEYDKAKETRYSELLSGFAFRLHGTSTIGLPVDLYAVTDGTGVAMFNNVLIGDNYTLEEVSQAQVIAAAASNRSAAAIRDQVTQDLKRYVVPAPQTVAVSYNKAAHTGNTTETSFHNILRKFRITIHKKDREMLQDNKAQQNATLAGAIYGLYDGDKLVKQYTTDANASFTTDYFALGDHWYLKELKPSEGYLADPNKYPIKASVDDIAGNNELNDASLDTSTQIDGDQNTVYEQVMKGSVKYYKIAGDTNETDKAWLAGAGFCVYDLSTLESVFGASLSGLSDSEIVQWAFDTLRDNKTQNYKKLYGTKTATVYAYPSDPDVTGGGLVKSFQYGGGQTVSAGGNKNEYIVSELMSGEDGVVKTPRLPYGRYLIVETTVPSGYVAAAPRVINITADDKDSEFLGDGLGTPNKDIAIWDADIVAYIEIKKKDTMSGKILAKPGAKYVIHDIDGAYFDLYMEDRTSAEKKEYKDTFGDLVVDYSAGYKGSYSNPYETVVQKGIKGENGSTYIRTTQPLPAGNYIIEEVAAPDQYVKQGYEGKYRVDAKGHRYYEVQDASDEKWNSLHQAMNDSMTGRADRDTSKADVSARVKVNISADTVLYDSLVRNFVIEAVQANDPAVGKLAVYAEGEYLKSAQQDGKTIHDLIEGSTFPGYTTGNTGSGDLSDFHNYTYNYEVSPIEGSTYVVKAAEDILSNDGLGTVLFHAGDTVTTLTTDAAGHAWTEEIVTAGGTYYGLPIGKYTIEQTKAGKGFALSEENKKPREFEITYDGETVPITFRDEGYTNPRQLADIRIGKYDIETEELIAGAVFGLFAKEDLKAKDGTTVIPADTLVAVAPTLETNGEVKLAEFREAYTVDGSVFEDGGLPLGRYYVKEIRAPKGYVSNNAVVDVEAVYNENQAGTVSFIGDSFESGYKFKNEQTKVRINVMDYDTLVELDDAELVIEDEDGNEMAVVVTVHNGTAVVRGLEVGKKYTVKEIKPRFGYSSKVYDKEDYTSPYEKTGYDIDGKHFDYVGLPLEDIDGDQFDFTVLDKGGVQTLDVFNKAVKANLEVVKTGETASVVVRNGEVESISYEVKGIPGAMYDVTVTEDIAHPDGYSGVLYAKGTLVGSITTDRNGTGSLKGLPLGKYTITETKAPRGFQRQGVKNVDLSTYYKTNYYDQEVYQLESYTFTTDFYNNRQIVDLGTDPKPENPGDPGDPGDPSDPDADKYLHTGVYKIGVDGDTEVPVAGAEFTLYANKDIIDVFGETIIPAGTKIETVLTDANGRGAFKTDLPIGEYVVRETAHPYGYYSTDAEVVFNTAMYEDDDTIKYIRMNGEIRNAITTTRLFLKDDLTKNELAGATLVITDDEGNAFTTVVTEDTDGEGHIIKGLDPDRKYTIEEVIPRPGYTNTVIIPEEMEDELTKEDRNKASFVVEDSVVDAELSNIPDDVVLEIDNAFVTGNINLTKDGEVLSSVAADTRKETILDKAVDWVKSVVAYELQKQSGVEFTVFAAEDIEHPDGKTGLLYKEGDTAGILVRTGEKPAVAVTGEDGTVRFEELYLGTYVVKETKIPYGYVENPTEVKVTLLQNDYETQTVEAVEGEVKFQNTAQKVHIAVTKRDQDDHSKTVPGAVFGLYAGEDITGGTDHVIIKKDLLLETAMTGDDGRAVFEAELPIGTYYLKEFLAPAGYTSSQEKIVVKAEFQPDGRKFLEFDFDYFNEKSKVDISKYISGTETEMIGATLTVIDDKGKEVETWITNGETHRIEGLLVGHEYTLREKSPAPGYVTAADVKFTVADRKDGKYEPQHVIMKDVPTRIQIDVEQKDYNGNISPLDDIPMHLEDMFGNTVYVDRNGIKWVSKNGETGYYEKVPVGDYKVVVDSVPPGYVPPKDLVIHVEDTDEIQHFVVQVETIIITTRAVDKETGEPVDDVYVDVLDKDHKVLYENVPLEWVQEYLPAGDYTLHFTKVPDGYVTPDDLDITVDEVTGMQNFVQELGVTHVSVRPVDKKTKKPVKGVKMHLENEDGKTVAKWTSGKGWEYFERIVPGRYLIVVDKVPAEYKKPQDKWIKIRNTEDLQRFEVKLEKAEKVEKPAPAPAAPKKAVKAPQTGDDFTTGEISMLAMLIVALFAVGIMLILSKRKQSGRNRKKA